MSTERNPKPAVAASGHQLTELDIDTLADEAEAGYDLDSARPIRLGRPSLSGESAHSPRVSFRAPPELRERAERVAAQQGKTVSTLA
jgi:hypothetical protein